MAAPEHVEEFIGKITDTRAGWGAEWARFHDERTHDERTAPLT